MAQERDDASRLKQISEEDLDSNIRQINLVEKECVPDSSFRHFECGSRCDNAKEYVILLVGETGAGKTTLINNFVNHIFGVNFDDPFRLILVPKSSISEELSQTQKISVYRLHHQPWFKIPCTLTLIDTPGVNDTSGIGRDKEIFDLIKDFFNAQNPIVNHINAVGYVVKSTKTRLTVDLEYVFHAVHSLFGKSVRNNIVLLFTFCDHKPPKALKTVEKCNIPTETWYKFNSSAVFSDEDGDRDLEEILWRKEEKMFHTFIGILSGLEEQTIEETKMVLKLRSEIEHKNRDACNMIEEGLKKLNELKNYLSTFKETEKDVEKYRRFTREKKVYVDVEKRLEEGALALMYRGFCMLIGKKPPATHMMVKEEVMRRVKDKDGEAKYTDAEKRTRSIQKQISTIYEDIIEHEQEVMQLIQQVGANIQKLMNIALEEPDPDLMIRYVEQKQKQCRISGGGQYKELQEHRSQAELMKKTAEGEYQPFKELGLTEEQVKEAKEAAARRKRRIDGEIQVVGSFILTLPTSTTNPTTS